MTTIFGVVDTITYYNEETGYSVLKLEDGTTSVGILPSLKAGDNIELTGDWIKHPKYGEQFQITNFNIRYPTTREGIIKFLSSHIIKGIGEKTAEKIVRVFGDRTLEIFDNNIERLREIKGFGQKKVEAIKASWKEQKGIKDIMLFLQSHGVSAAYAVKIFNVYGGDALEVVKKNPYQLAADIWGIGFRKADNIGRKIGLDAGDPKRIKAGIIFTLEEAARNGHVYMPEHELIQSCSYLLNYDLIIADPLLIQLELEKKIIYKNNKVYLDYLYYAERGVEKLITNLLLVNIKHVKLNDKLFNQIKHDFSDEQLSAIDNSLKHKILILSGGPGTGKTATLKGIINLYKKLSKKILLAAPTGRAAKRMSEMIGLEAKTIHRMLEYNPSINLFSYNEANQLQTDLLVIDEVSMIDIALMYQLLLAVSINTTLILVGDVDQLPSVGPGNVLKDLINSKKIPIVKLTKIFRQAEESQIITVAHQINSGVFPNIYNKSNSDVFLIEEENTVKIPELILDLCSRRLPAAYNINPLADIQVLSPMHKGDTGVINLNKVLQEGLNKSEVLLKHRKTEFKRGDKVMQIRNNYEKDVFNGDIGFVYHADAGKKVLFVSFNNKMLKYEAEGLDELTIAYCITVHKSQGSEYPCIILPMSTSHFSMLQRNLLYTAVTRASKLMIIIGSKRALAVAIENNRVQKRYTSLFNH